MKLLVCALSLVASAVTGAMFSFSDNPKPTPPPQQAIQEPPRLPEPIDCIKVFQQHQSLRLKRASDGKIVYFDPCFAVEAIEFEAQNDQQR